MLGFDALGRLSLGQLPGGGGISGYTLSASVASFSVTARSTTRGIARSSLVASFAMTGRAATLTASNVHQYVFSAAAAVFALTGGSSSYAQAASRVTEFVRPLLSRVRVSPPKLTE